MAQALFKAARSLSHTHPPLLACLSLVASFCWAEPAAAAQVKVDLEEKHQTIDGFGFFGAMDSWWGDGPLVSDEWAELVVQDLGLSIWRNEYYPPADEITGQDADWEKQKAVVEGIHQAAQDASVPLKFIFTVWSPPSKMKCLADENHVVTDGTPHTGGAKKGGAVCPSERENFGAWLSDGVGLYASLGIDLYALSIQNEPLFVQDYNSCVYNVSDYATVLNVVAPIVRKTYPKVRFFGAENMLEIESADENIPWFYSTALMGNESALKELDIWAVHGYSDGVLPTAGSRMSTLWKNFKSNFSGPTKKPVWMTETSGYNDKWNTSEGGDAMDLALAIYSALHHGDAAAWVWWQGSGSVVNDYSLMKGIEEQSKRYYVHKHFARFIRPGARQVGVTSEDEELFVTAFTHDELDNLVLVAINPSAETKKLELQGADLPDEFDWYLTDGSTNCEEQGVVQKDAIQLPPGSLVTLVNGSVYEADLPPDAGTSGGGAEGGPGNKPAETTTGDSDGDAGSEQDPGEKPDEPTGSAEDKDTSAGDGDDKTNGDDSSAESDTKGGCGCSTPSPAKSNWWLVALAAGAMGLTGLRRKQS